MKSQKKEQFSLELNDIGNEGVFYIPTEHYGNSQRSDEEADIIYEYYSKYTKKNMKMKKR